LTSHNFLHIAVRILWFGFIARVGITLLGTPKIIPFTFIFQSVDSFEQHRVSCPEKPVILVLKEKYILNNLFSQAMLQIKMVL